LTDPAKRALEVVMMAYSRSVRTRVATVVLLPVAVFAAAPVAGSLAFAQAGSQPDGAGGAVITLPGQALAPAPGAMAAPAGSAPPVSIEVPALPGAVLVAPSSASSSGAPLLAPGPVSSGQPEDAPAEIAADATSADSWSQPGDSAAAAEGGIGWELDRPLPGDVAGAAPARRRPQLSDAGSPSPLEGAGNPSAADQALIAREPRLERDVEPAKRAELTGLARTLGALHALRVSCGGRDDQTWRSRMATLLDLEAPASGTLRDPLVVAFNGGFQAGGRGIATCPTDPRAAEARLARQGRQFALALAARYRPAPPPADAASAAAAPPGQVGATPGQRPSTASTAPAQRAAASRQSVQ
jgi:uncharacterized protein (TIGR02301 family)